MESEIEAAAVVAGEWKEEAAWSRHRRRSCHSLPVRSESADAEENGDEADKRAEGAAFDAASGTFAAVAAMTVDDDDDGDE